MNEIRIFDNPEFGEVRTVMIGEKEYFYGVDVATALMYKRPRKAITDNCKGVLTQDSLLNNGGYPELLITEGDIYRLTIKAGQQNTSKEIKDKAERFEKWIFDEVLPALRKTGTYELEQNPLKLLEVHYEAIKQVNQKVETLEERVDKIELDLPILPIEADRITVAARRKGVAVLGGKKSAGYKDRGLRQKVYSNLYANLKYNFGVRSYKAIKRSQCDRAVEIIGRYEPPVFLADQIVASNAQMNLTEI